LWHKNIHNLVIKSDEFGIYHIRNLIYPFHF